MMDAFTTSDSYPYSTHYSLGDNSVNYMRNSVKVVIDAYNGTTTFYVFDTEDPILAAYRRIFPSLFKDASTMPADLRKHVRYPGDALQAAVRGLRPLPHDQSRGLLQPRRPLDRRHRNRHRRRRRAGRAAHAAQLRPDEAARRDRDAEFVEILPFTPANRNNLIGWIAGRCDGDNYGTSVVYDFPKTRLVDGPQQIEVAHRPERAALRPTHSVEPAGLARPARQPARHPLRQGAPLRRTNLPPGPAKPHARAAPRRPRAAGQARLRPHLRGRPRLPLRRRSSPPSARPKPRPASRTRRTLPGTAPARHRPSTPSSPKPAETSTTTSA